MKLRALILALPASQAQAQTWVEHSIIGTTLDNSKAPIALFANTYTGVGVPPGEWVTLDFTQVGVPNNAVEAFLSGILIITGGSTNQICDLTVTFRAPGSVLPPANYQGQVITVGSGTGQRSTFSTWVPLVAGKTEVYWNRTDSVKTQWPVGCSYGINLSVQAYVR